MLLLLFINYTTSISCIVGRPGCVASCIVQNCATGYCTGAKDGWDGTCVCSRCARGGYKPL